MSEMAFVTDKEKENLQTLDYDQLIDWQFNLMQEIVDTSNEIIHKEYKDDHILQQGMIVLRRMALLNMVNQVIFMRFPKSKMSELLSEQYTQSTLPLVELINGEISRIKAHFDEISEVLMLDFENIKRRVDGMDTVNRIATLNLREYEDVLNRVFTQPRMV